MRKQILSEIAAERYPVIGSARYSEVMDRSVCAVLEESKAPFVLTARDGQVIRGSYYSAKGHPRGSVLISHGFSECGAKYQELIYYFLREGYHVCIPDHRGHGKSRIFGDTLPGTTATDVTDFQDYVDDLDMVIEKVMRPKAPEPFFLYSHSMGGMIAALYLEQHPGVFRRAVLNAPMLEINRGGLPLFAAKAAAGMLCLLGKGGDFLPGQSPFNEREDFAGSAATCYERYRYFYDQQMADPTLRGSGSSCRWTREALRACERGLRPENCGNVTIPVLLFQAESDAYVLPGGQERFIASIPNGRIVFVPGSKHEIYLGDDETLSQYIQVLMAFLKEDA